MKFFAQQQHWRFEHSFSPKFFEFLEGKRVFFGDGGTVNAASEAVAVAAVPNSVNTDYLNRQLALRRQMMRPENKDAYGGMGNFKVNITDEFDKKLKANDGPVVDGQKNHFRVLMGKIAQNEKFASNSSTKHAEEMMVGSENFQVEVLKNPVYQNSTVKEWYLDKNPTVQKDAHSSFARLRQENLKKITTVERDIQQGWKGLYNGFSGADISQTWAYLGMNEPRDISEISEEKALSLLKTIEKQKILSPSSGVDYSRVQFLCQQILEKAKFLRQNEYALALSGQKNPAQQVRYDYDATISQISTAIAEESAKASPDLLQLQIYEAGKKMLELEKQFWAQIPNSDPRVTLESFQLQKIEFEEKIKNLEKALEAQKAQFPHDKKYEVVYAQQKLEIGRSKEFFKFLDGYSTTAMQSENPSFFLQQKLGYETNETIKEEQKAALVDRSVYMMAETYQYTYETLKNIPGVGESGGFEAVNLMVEMCMLHGVSPKDLKIGLQNLTVHSGKEGVDTVTVSEFLSWILAMHNGTLKEIPAGKIQYLQTSFPNWESISSTLTNMTGNKSLENLLVDQEEHQAAVADFERSFGKNTSVNASQMYFKWNELLSDKSNEHYGNLGLDQWFEAEKVKNPASMAYLLQQTLPSQNGNTAPLEYSLENFNAEYTQTGKISDKYIAYLNQLHNFFSSEHETALKMENAGENMKAAAAMFGTNKVSDFLVDKLENTWEGIKDMDLRQAAPGVIGILLLYQLWKKPQGKNALMFVGAAWAADELWKLEESQIDNLLGYAFGSSEENSKNLAFIIAKRNEDFYDNANLEHVKRAGTYMGEKPSKEMMDWYTAVKKNKATPDCKDLYNIKTDPPFPLAKESRKIAGESSKNANEESAKASFVFLEGFFKNVAEDHGFSSDISSAEKGAKNLKESLSVDKGFDIVYNKYILQKGTNPAMQKKEGFSMLEIFNMEISKEEKEKSLAMSSALWGDVKNLYKDSAENALAFFRRNGITKPPLEYAKDFYASAATLGYTVMSVIGNEIALQDRFGNMLNIAEKTIDGTKKWVLQDAAGGFLGLNGGAGYASFGEAWGALEEQAERAGAMTMYYATEAQKNWAGFWNDIPMGEIGKEISPYREMAKDERSNTLFKTIDSLGIMDAIQNTYGIDRREDLLGILGTLAEQPKFQADIINIAKVRLEREKKMKGNTTPLNTGEIKITNGDILVYFFSGMYGLGKVGQGTVDAAQGVSEFVSGFASGTVGIVSDSGKAFLETYAADHAMDGFFQDIVDGTGGAKADIHTIVKSSLTDTSKDNPKDFQYTFWTGSVLSNFAEKEIKNLLATLSPTTGTFGGVNTPSMDAKPAVDIISSFMQRKLADGNMRRIFLSEASFWNGTEYVSDKSTIAGYPFLPTTEQVKLHLKTVLNGELNKENWKVE